MNEVIATANDEYYSKQSIINWINTLLKVNITKIEQLGTGALYCQIIDMIYPGYIQMQKVNWKAKYDYEFASNFRILQNAFSKLNIQKPIEVEKLIKCKCIDNLELVQWLKKFYDANYQIKEYDPIGRRGNTDPDFTQVEKMSQAKQLSKDATMKIQSIKQNKMIPQPKTLQQMLASQSYTQSRTLSKNSSNSNLNISKEIAEQEAEKSSPQKSIPEYLPYFDALKSERDFFYEKLKNVDVLLEKYTTNPQFNDIVQNIKAILYAEPQQQIQINEDGSLNIQIDDKDVKIDEIIQNKKPIEDLISKNIQSEILTENLNPTTLTNPTSNQLNTQEKNNNTITNSMNTNNNSNSKSNQEALKDIQNLDANSLDNPKKQLQFDNVAKNSNSNQNINNNNTAANNLLSNLNQSDLNTMIIEDENLLMD